MPDAPLRAPALTARLFLLLLALTGLSSPGLLAQGFPNSFREAFALATDRRATLEQLIPGSVEHYYHASLLAQHEGRFDEVPPMLARWIERHGRSKLVEEIENRQALLTYERDPDAAYRFLRERLDPDFSAQRELPGVDPELPTRLDPSLLDVRALTARALAAHPGTVAGLRGTALWRFAAAGDVDDELLTPLLQKLDDPSVPGLARLIVRQLALEKAGPFGALKIHQRLLRSQLEEVVASRPEVLTQRAFVDAYLQRLRPSSDVDWQRDPAHRQRYLEELQAFAARLPAVHRALQAHVLYHRLAFDLTQGVSNRERVLSYLRLPCRQDYRSETHLRRTVGRDRPAVEHGVKFPTGLAAVGNDEAVVRQHLERLLAGAESVDAYAEYLDAEWLQSVFAETKILHGVGDPERWYALLDKPERREQLRDRVEIRFAATAPERFAVEAPVTLPVETKNVDKLIARVFEIDTFNHLRQRGRDVDPELQLEGLVASDERTFHYDDSPLLRVARNLEFPAIPQRPGVWIIELIGGGVSSRAVIRKGSLHCTERVGAAGHVFEIFDQDGIAVPEATVWFGGREYEPDESGQIVLPFSTRKGTKTVLLVHGSFAASARFAHETENYDLDAGLFVARESLIAGGTARILLQPQLSVSGASISLSHLSDPALEITMTDLEGDQRTQVVRDLELYDHAACIHEMLVPERLAKLDIRLRARIESLSRGKTIDVLAPRNTYAINEIDSRPLTYCALLGRNRSGYVLDVIGKDGEPRGDLAAHVSIRAMGYDDPIDLTMRTDARGRIELGPLAGVFDVTARLEASGQPLYWFQPHQEAHTRLPKHLHGTPDQTLRLPWPHDLGRLERSTARLFELRAGKPAYDRFDALRVQDGFLEIRGLTAGDHVLDMPAAGRVRIRIAAGTVDAAGRLRTAEHLLSRETGDTIHVGSVSADAGDLTIRLHGAAAKSTRVHVVTTRYLPDRGRLEALLARGSREPGVLALGGAGNRYLSGRRLGDEARYILERRFAKRFPGNMLQRPGMLLNPWTVDAFDADSWNSAIGLGGGAGGRFGGRGGGARTARAMESGDFSYGADFANLDFLGTATKPLCNLRPDAEGVLRIPLAKLGDGHLVHVFAGDGQRVAYRQFTLPERPLEPTQQRLASALDPARDYAQTRRIEFVAAGAEARVADVRSADVAVYDSLSTAFELMRATAAGRGDLDRFAFLLTWPELDAAEKRALYSDHACHELHIFLRRKDPEFFAEVVKPYLANKLHKQFLDHWLLDADLSGYLEPHRFAQLNAAERALLARSVGVRGESIRRRLRDELGLQRTTAAQRSALIRGALLSGEMNEGAEDALRALMKNAKGKTIAPQPDRSGAEFDEDEPAEEPVLEDAEVEEVTEEEASEIELQQRRRNANRALFRDPGPTEVWIERNYWQVPASEQGPALIGTNAFWIDFAVADPAQPFVSTNLVVAARGSFAEVLLALAFSDLPFRSGDHTTRLAGTDLTLRAGSPLLLVREEIAEAPRDTDAPPVLVSQNVYRLDEPLRSEDGRQVDAYLNDELLTGVAYGCRVVVTNPTSIGRDFELLTQIPAGALPVSGGFRTRGVPIHLDAYGTQSVEFAFYFPVAGDVVHYPARVTAGGKQIAAARDASARWRVVTEPTQVDTNSWSHVSQQAETRAVHDFMWRSNLLELDLSRIAWRMRDRAFYTATLALLRERQIYSDALWSWSLFHGDDSAAREYLQQQHGFIDRCGVALRSPLLTIDPVEQQTHQLAEFRPLFHARAHPIGADSRPLSGTLETHYRTFLDVLIHRPRPSAEDLATATCLLLVQDRVAEALELFERIDADALPAKLQYDYLRCYLDFFSADHAKARGIAERYADYPVTRWREAFGEVLAHLDEAEGRLELEGTGDAGTGNPGDLAVLAEPSLEFDVNDTAVQIDHANVESVQLAFYEMDVEFLFSAQPFLQQDSDAFALVRPNHSATLELTSSAAPASMQLPDSLRGKDLLVEVRGGGVVRRKVHHANTLRTRWMESQGQLRVAEASSGRPLAAVYVKVYARLADGTVRFHKDGYTDIRGRFDYVSVSGTKASEAERLAILVLDDTHGAIVRELAPPAR